MLALYADLPFMYLFELVADDLCWPVTYSRATAGYSGLALSGVLPGDEVATMRARAIHVSSSAARPRVAG